MADRAPDRHDDSRAGHRPGLPAAQAPGPSQASTCPSGRRTSSIPRRRRRCTAALLLEVDPVALVRGRKGPAGEGFTLGQYVNDRPYAASSMLAVALARVFRTAMAGRCDARPELAATPLPLSPRAGPALPRRRRRWPAAVRAAGLAGDATPIPLDPPFPAGGTPATSTCAGRRLRLADALNHLYVLLPGARRREALLGVHRRGRQAGPRGRRLARRAPGTRPDHPALPGPPAATLTAALARLAEVDDTEPDDARQRHRRAGRSPTSRTARCRWPSSGAARSSPCCARPVRAGRRPGLRRGRLLARCSPTPPSPRSSAPTCRPARWSRRRASCGSTGCPSASGPGCRLFQSSLTYRDGGWPGSTPPC